MVGTRDWRTHAVLRRVRIFAKRMGNLGHGLHADTALESSIHQISRVPVLVCPEEPSLALRPHLTTAASRINYHTY